MGEIIDEEYIDKKKRSPISWLIFIWLVCIFIGILFKILHWPGSSLFQVMGLGGLIAHIIYETVIEQKPNFVNLTFGVLFIAFDIIVIRQYRFYNLNYLLFVGGFALLVITLRWVISKLRT